MPHRRSPGLEGPRDLFEPPPTPSTPAIVQDEMSFREICETLRSYFKERIESPLDLGALKISPVVTKLANQLAYRSHNPSTLAGLLWCRAQFAFSDLDENSEGLGAARALACELVACELSSCLSSVELLEYLTYEMPPPEETDSEDEASESAPLFASHGGSGTSDPERGASPEYVGLNTLEIAVMADSKKFISHRPVQRIITGIWDGSISFWKSLDVTGSKKPHFYNPRKSDPWCRLRVPRYQKVFEATFFAALLALYYTVLYERNPYHITGSEVALVVFFLAFMVDEFGSMKDSGVRLYAQDFWSWLDMSMIIIGVAFLVLRILGVVKHSDDITDTAFDVLSLEALLLVPRVFSLLSLHPYFGVLIPCLKQMTKEFLQFLILIGILYIGFLTTFSLLARDRMSYPDVFWLLIYVFFGSPNIGFDAMREISPVLGPPLMLVFVSLTSILLITSLISLLSISLSNMMANAREEYLFMFSIMVLETSTSNRLVVYYPPLNLLPLILLRPLRLLLGSEKIRSWRIALLKFSHFPFAAIITAFEKSRPGQGTNTSAWGPSSGTNTRLPVGLGLLSANRSGGDWGGRLGGGRLGFVGRGIHTAAISSASSARADFQESAFSGGQTRLAVEDHEEIKRIKLGLEELNRKMDALLAQRS